MQGKSGLALIISGPSGVGKGTVINSLLPQLPEYSLTISHTTRVPRNGEINNQHYHFISINNFNEAISSHKFAEWAQVHGNYYGTSMEYVENVRKGKHHLFEVDVQGAKSLINVFNNFKLPFLSIFLLPPSSEILNQRLAGRGTECRESLNIRLQNAETELAQSMYFNYSVVNDRIEDTVKTILVHLRKKENVMEKKSDKFLYTYAISRRAKEIMEEGIHLMDPAEAPRNPILEAMTEMSRGLVQVEIAPEKAIEVKPEDETFEALYTGIKYEEDKSLPKRVINTNEPGRAKRKIVDIIDDEVLDEEEQEQDEDSKLEVEEHLDEAEAEAEGITFDDDIEPEFAEVADSPEFPADDEPESEPALKE